MQSLLWSESPRLFASNFGVAALHQRAYPFRLTRAAASGANGDTEFLGVLFTNLRVGLCPATRAVEAPGLHRNQVVARQGFVQASLVGRFTGKAERIVMHAIGGETELRVMVRNALHELTATLFNMVEIGFVERTDPLARLRLVGHPPRPIEAIHEVVDIAKVDR